MSKLNHMNFKQYSEAFLDPDEKTPFKKRLGRCYELAGRFAMHNPGTALVHGSIQGFGNPRIDHAWVELGGKKIWEPASGKEWDSEIFAAVFKPKPHNWYETKELYAKAGTEGTWGPWDEL